MHQGHDPAAEVTGPHGAGDHGEAEHGHDDHAHVDEELGPIDWTMWAVGVLGVAFAIVIAAGFVVATGFSFSA
jgi:hypothetical protein